MSEIALAKINSFGPSPKADNVSSSEEPVFILTSSQLQSLITKAATEAIQPLQDRISSLGDRIASLEKENAALTATQETQADNQLIQLRLINDIRGAVKKDAQPLQKDRADILRALIATNGGKMLAKDARQKMHLSRSLFSMLLTTMQEDIEVKTYSLKRNQKVLILR